VVHSYPWGRARDGLRAHRVFFYGAAIFAIGLAGVLWLVGGNSSANSFSGFSN
jgi:uncharacterized protein involved in response to NO